MTAEAERLRGLHQAAERIAASLVELELDSSRKLLEATALSGESAARWATASRALSELWRRRGLLEELLERADEAQRSNRTEELRSLIAGPSIELSSTDVPVAERTLLGTVRSVERCSPSDLLAAMSQTFDEVKVVFGAFGVAWERLLPGIEAARGLLRDCTRRAGELGESGRRDLETAEQEVERLTRALGGDPLSIAMSEIDELIDSLGGIRDELDEIAALRQRFDVRMLDARELLERVALVEREARVAHEESAVKVAQPSAPPVHPVPPELEAELTAIVDLAQRGAWTEARRALERWTAHTRAVLDDVVTSRDANRAPIEARDQFRALLEAYQVKAKRLGLLEDSELADLWARAHDALYTAPTDLAVAARLVRSYQESLTGVRPPREATS
jgi:hypothetical protein